jgi:hypothetical protein
MALQLIDLANELNYIDIKRGKVPYAFSIKLIDKTYSLTIKYNELGGFYTADLRTNTGEILAFGDPIRYGRALFGSIEDERFPLPVIIPYCVTGDNINEVTTENFGDAVRLYLYERRADKWNSG